MPPRKKAKAEKPPGDERTLWDFLSVIDEASVLSRDEVAGAVTDGYNPVEETANYMERAVRLEKVWETTVAEARKRLLEADARTVFLDFFEDLISRVKHGGPKALRYATLLEQVGTRGFGMTKEALNVDKAPRGGSGPTVRSRREVIEEHINNHVFGEHFLNHLKADGSAWDGRSPLIAASDVSQHRSAVPVPAAYFKRSVLFVLNNAAGTVFRLHGDGPKFDNLFNPRPDDSLLRWMLIDPSYQDDLEPEDYQRCLASAMDVGQYKFDLEYLMMAKNPPDIIFRDGSLFPQDAYLDNFVIENKRGDFTREAIKQLFLALQYAKGTSLIYCGVSKNVQLKMYSSVLDWYIARNIDKEWDFGSYTFNDGEAMSLLLSSGEFVGSNLDSVISTCLIQRSFTTRANLNTRADVRNLTPYFALFQGQHEAINITDFRRLCEIGHVAMFFMGHSKTPQQRLPRYEFFIHDGIGPIPMVPHRVLGALQACGIMNDNDHSFMAEKPVTYLLPSVTQHAHLLSKDVGRHIDTATGQYIMSRYRKLLTKHD